jgi:hypothetical protein
MTIGILVAVLVVAAVALLYDYVTHDDCGVVKEIRTRAILAIVVDGSTDCICGHLRLIDDNTIDIVKFHYKIAKMKELLRRAISCNKFRNAINLHVAREVLKVCKIKILSFIKQAVMIIKITIERSNGDYASR